MSEKGIKPVVQTYTILIDGYMKNECFDQAFDLRNKMQEVGIACNEHTYNALISGLCKADLYTEMIASGNRPDVITYTAMTSSLCDKGYLENAHSVLRQMDEAGLCPNVLVYNMLIAGYFREGNFQEGYRLHDEMLDKGLKPDDTTYDILVSLKFGDKPFVKASCMPT
ncbi:hypothetical protein HPP92_023170 [Vanilla planifolia]|uniref:Pentatricopeptide repeat-containing protein n=1 Tax=Vanilla planifolia TaxID=51239 RepID=A0A835PVJ8_VANPL|nr:hypothetical protein HPP92_023170 [Vanilla planifolia]